MLNVLRLAATKFQQGFSTIFHLITAGYFRRRDQHSTATGTEPQKMKSIVILGGSYAGVSTAHRILKQANKSATAATPFKITLVSPNSHFYWSMASPRGVLPGQLTDEQMFQPIAAGFKQYPASRFEFILAYATALDVDEKTVTISDESNSQAVERALDYDYLILATGSNTRNKTPFKGLGSTEATKTALHDFQARIEKAKTIVVAGGGVTGVEAAGELAFQYGPQKEIILIVSGSNILEETPLSVSKLATKALQDLHVQIKFQTRIVDAGPTAVSDQKGQQQLILSDGSTLLTDMYIPTFGLLPNSRYVPIKFLNAGGFVTVDEFLNVKGKGNGIDTASLKDVWALGDVSDLEYAQFVSCDKQSVYLAKNVILALRADNNRPPLPYKAATKRFMGLQIGRKAGTGHFGTMKVPSFVVVWARKNLFMDNLRPTVDGSLF